MNRSALALFLLLSTFGLAACQSSDEPEPEKAAAPLAELHAPAGADDNASGTAAILSTPGRPS